MALLCVAGLLGLFGGGPFSSRHLSARDLELRYDGMVRMGTPQTLKLRVTPVHGAARIALANLAEARRSHGLERLSQIRCAVLERNGCISIIPEAHAKA